MTVPESDRGQPLQPGWPSICRIPSVGRGNPSRVIVRLLVRALALNRVVFGIAYLVAPARTGRGWIGKAAEKEATRVFTRALGARDLALGVGALRALAGDDVAEARAWMAAHAVADGMDLAATVAARRRLPQSGFRFASAMAAGSTAVALLGVFGLRDLA